MKPLQDMPAEVLANIRGVFFDIDDTLTSEGRLTASAYSALERIQAAGLLCVPVTGRPAGWCDHIARMWPVDGVVGENGAFWFAYDAATRKMTQRFMADAATGVDCLGGWGAWFCGPQFGGDPLANRRAAAASD